MTILLCSNNESVKARWTDLLSAEYSLDYSATVAAMKKLIAGGNIDIILIHRSLVDMNTVLEIRQSAPSCKIFLLSDRPDEDEGLAFFKIGIVGYANTYISPMRLSEAIRVIASGSVWIGQTVMDRLIRETLVTAEENNPNPSNQALVKLTNREREIAELVAKGNSNLEIAADLDITERTVKAHLSSIYAKTGSATRLNLALMVKKAK